METPNQRIKMLELVKSSPVEEVLEDEINTIELPEYDIIVHVDRSWFEQMILDQQNIIERLKKDTSLN